jgi:hypothetical protein
MPLLWQEYTLVTQILGLVKYYTQERKKTFFWKQPQAQTLRK